MANKYILKKGVFLRQIGLQPLCEWTLRDNDSLAEQYLKNDASLVKYFSSVPGKTEYTPPPVSVKPSAPIEIIEPKKVEEVKEVKEVKTPPVEVIKAERKPRKRAKTKK